MESDDDYETFSFHNDEPEPSPSPKHRRLKRLKKSTVLAVQSTNVGSASEQLDFPRVDFASLEALESSDIRAFDVSNEPLSSQSSEGFDGDGDEKQLISGFDDTRDNGDRKETKRSPELEEGFDADDGVKIKELSSCFEDDGVNTDRKETKGDLEIEEGFDDDNIEQESGSGDTHARTDRKKTKRALEFDDEINESGVDQRVGKESETINVEIRDDGEKDVNGDAMNEKKSKKKRSKISGDDPKAKTSSSNKRKEAKERRAHLEQLHAESQRLLRETRGVSFKPIPLVQKPISSILERIRQRKLEMSKKFSQSINNDMVKEDDVCLEKAVIDHPNSVEAEASELSETLKEKNVSNVPNEDPELDDVAMDEPDLCGEQKGHEDACSPKALNEECTPAFRAPVDDTQELFGDSQTSDNKESIDEEASDEQTTSSQEEEMGPSLLTMKLKFDSVPDDVSDEEENDKENVDPIIEKHSSPKGDPVKAFVDDEADEEDDSDNDRMRFGDDEEDEDEDDDDIEELGKMIATGYEERPIDLEARNELHQKWLEEKDAAGTDDLLRRLNVASKFREESLLDEEDVEVNDEVDVDEDVERPRVARIDSKKAKEMIAQMFNDKDEDFLSSDDDETEKILARERLINKTEEKVKLVSPVDDEDSRDVFRLIKKLNTVPESRKKAKTTSFFDTMLTGGNSNSSSKSSFLSRMSNHSVPTSTKQGGSSGARSYIFGRDDSNSRSSISISEVASDTTTSREIHTKKYSSSQSQAKSSTQTAKLVAESRNSTSSFFEILKRSSVKSNVENQDHKVELSQSVFAAFKIPKKPIKIQGRA